MLAGRTGRTEDGWEEELEGFQEKWGKFWGYFGHQAFLVESPRFLVEPEKNGFYMVQSEGFLGTSKRADWVQQKARGLPGVRHTGMLCREAGMILACGECFADSAELWEAEKRVEAAEQSPLGSARPRAGPFGPL